MFVTAGVLKVKILSTCSTKEEQPNSEIKHSLVKCQAARQPLGSNRVCHYSPVTFIRTIKNVV